MHLSPPGCSVPGDKSPGAGGNQPGAWPTPSGKGSTVQNGSRGDGSEDGPVSRVRGALPMVFLPAGVSLSGR